MFRKWVSISSGIIHLYWGTSIFKFHDIPDYTMMMMKTVVVVMMTMMTDHYDGDDDNE